MKIASRFNEVIDSHNSSISSVREFEVNDIVADNVIRQMEIAPPL
jgi:hypothetical protein